MFRDCHQRDVQVRFRLLDFFFFQGDVFPELFALGNQALFLRRVLFLGNKLGNFIGARC